METATVIVEKPASVVIAPADDIDVLLILQRLWRRKLLLLLFLSVAIGGAMLYLANVRYKYSAELAVTPADQNGSKVPSNLANLGSLVGVDIGSQAGSAFAIFSDTVRSYPVAEVLARDRKLMRTIFRDQWDPQTRQWREPRSAIGNLSKMVKSFIGAPVLPYRRPTAIDLRGYIREYVIVTEDKKKSIVLFSYRHEDPKFAAALLQRLVDASDDFLRAKSLQRSATYVRYLERRINEVQVAEYRNSLAQALISYESTRMMASSDASFAAEQFGDVWVSARPTTPVPLIVLGISMATAFALWLIFVLIVESIRASLLARRAMAAEPAMLAD